MIHSTYQQMTDTSAPLLSKQKPSAKDVRHYVIFRINRQAYALPLAAIQRAVRMVAVTPLPGAALDVHGMVNVAGAGIPALNLRRLFGLAEREPELSDRLLIVEDKGHTAALMVDEVVSVIEAAPGALLAPSTGLAQSRFIEGTIPQEDGIILVLSVKHLLERKARS